MSSKKTFALVIVAMTLWGAGWPSAKVISSMVDYKVLVFWRFFIAFVSFLPILIYLKQSLLVNKKAIPYILLGTIFYVAFIELFFIGVKNASAGMGGVIFTIISPIPALILSVILFNVEVGLKKIIGFHVGIFAVCLILDIWQFSYDSFYKSGNLYLVLCAICWGLITVVSQKASSYISPLMFSFTTAGLSTLIVFLDIGFKEATSALSLGYQFWLNIIFLASFTSAFATTIYFIAVKEIGSHKASAFIFLVPLSAVGFSWLFLGEKIDWFDFVGAIFATIALYLIN